MAEQETVSRARAELIWVAIGGEMESLVAQLNDDGLIDREVFAKAEDVHIVTEVWPADPADPTSCLTLLGALDGTDYSMDARKNGDLVFSWEGELRMILAHGTWSRVKHKRWPGRARRSW